MRHAFHTEAQSMLAQELRRLGAPATVDRACAQVIAAVVERVLEDARHEPRLAAALASIYGSDAKPRTTIAPWPVEAARRG
jgi:hypothetical protein